MKKWLFFADGIDIDKALNNPHPYSNNGWVTDPRDRGTGNPNIEFGCATAIKALTGAPATASWRRGKKVKGNTTIAPGTAIATFARQANGKFLFKGHAAIFCNHNMGNGFMVYDQWRDAVVDRRKHFSKRPIYPKCKGYVSNDAEAFYFIELVEYSSGDPLFCGPGSSA
ncbi:MAG: BPSL0067 family protein [Azoarcus sp.]|jgi:hypothetical protein|nr:BPSL0067 family protein [Azoarcus sp.]